MAYNYYFLKDFVELNPKENLKKGAIAKKVPMELLSPFCRDITKYEISEYSGGSKFRNGDTIMARITPCLENGKRARVSILDNNEIAFGSTEYIVFRARKDISDADFIYYLVCSDLIRQPAIKSMVGSSGRQRVQTDVIENLQLLLPPLPIQKKIAAVLSALDDKIELNNKINQNLEQQAQAIFKSWFVDFEPFGGKMPDDWKMGKLIDIADVESGKRPISQQNQKSKTFNIPLVGASCVMGYTDNYLYNQKILITGRVGTHGIVQRFHSKCWPSDNTLVVLTEAFEYVYQVLRTINYSALNRGSTQPLITQTDLKNTEVIIPAKVVLDHFEKKVSSLMLLTHFNSTENLRLSQLRDALLPKLMSGEVDVSKVNIDDFEYKILGGKND